LQQACARGYDGKPRYKEYDRISVPEDVPSLGIKTGDTGVVRGLDQPRDGVVVASVEVSNSARQTKGWLGMQVRPEEKVLSFAPGG